MRATLLSLALAALAAASPLEERQTTAGGLSNVLSDISLLASGLGKMGAAIGAPGGNSAAYSSQQLNTFYDVTQNTGYDAGNVSASLGNSATFNQADSVKLGAALISTLKPAVTSMASQLVAHKAGFQAASATAQVSIILGFVSGDAMGIASTVIGKLTGPTAAADASAASSTLASVFASARAAYP
jgi:hypothetical protein